MLGSGQSVTKHHSSGLKLLVNPSSPSKLYESQASCRLTYKSRMVKPFKGSSKDNLSIFFSVACQDQRVYDRGAISMTAFVSKVGSCMLRLGSHLAMVFGPDTRIGFCMAFRSSLFCALQNASIAKSLRSKAAAFVSGSRCHLTVRKVT